MQVIWRLGVDEERVVLEWYRDMLRMGLVNEYYRDVSLLRRGVATSSLPIWGYLFQKIF